MFRGLMKTKYAFCVSPMQKHPFDFNKEETAEYFAWYMEQVPARVAYLAEFCAAEMGIPVSSLDLSPESLRILWKWFRRRARTERIPREIRRARREQQPMELWMGRRQLTAETEYILRDVGMYLGETFRKNHSCIYWTYYTKPKRDFFVNHPLLKGFVDRSFGEPFEAAFEPVHMAHVQAAKILTGKSSDDDLYNLYLWWAERAEGL